MIVVVESTLAIEALMPHVFADMATGMIETTASSIVDVDDIRDMLESA